MECAGVIFALISKTNCAVITQLLRSQTVQLQAFVQCSVVERILSSHRRKNPAILKVDVNVYGTRDEASGVGKILSSGGLTLQQPINGLDGITYYNPHFLHIPELEGRYIEETPKYNLSQAQRPQTREKGPRPAGEDAASDGDTKIETIFNGLAHAQQLQKRVTDQGIKTVLQE